MNFSGFANLQAGSGTNTFDISGDIDDGEAGPVNLLGGSGDNSFDFSDTAVLDGNIVGGTGTNTLSYYDSDTSTAYQSGLDISLDSVDAGGYSGTSLSIDGAFSDINTIVGNADGGFGCEIDGLGDPGTWVLGGGSAMTYTDTASDSNPSLNLDGFSDVYGGTGNDTFDIDGDATVNLNGGSGDDDFVFAHGAVLNGTIAGTDGVNYGTNTLDLSAYTTAIDVTLDSGGAGMGVGGTTSGATNPIVGRFDNISTIIAGTPSSGSSTLTGEDATRTWDLGSTDTYGDGTNTFVTYSGFDTLTAGGAPTRSTSSPAPRPTSTAARGPTTSSSATARADRLDRRCRDQHPGLHRRILAGQRHPDSRRRRRRERDRRPDQRDLRRDRHPGRQRRGQQHAHGRQFRQHLDPRRDPDLRQRQHRLPDSLGLRLAQRRQRRRYVRHRDQHDSQPQRRGRQQYLQLPGQRHRAQRDDQRRIDDGDEHPGLLGLHVEPPGEREPLDGARHRHPRIPATPGPRRRQRRHDHADRVQFGQRMERHREQRRDAHQCLHGDRVRILERRQR